jgi:hypothetical protein
MPDDEISVLVKAILSWGLTNPISEIQLVTTQKLSCKWYTFLNHGKVIQDHGGGWLYTTLTPLVMTDMSLAKQNSDLHT